MSGNLNMPGAPGQNAGHGHVFLRPDGARARCGGPALCRQCREDAARRHAPVDWAARFRDAADVAAEKGEHSAGFDLSVFASDLEAMPPQTVEAIGRALGGETS